jgi:hypothetical protein
MLIVMISCQCNDGPTLEQERTEGSLEMFDMLLPGIGADCFTEQIPSDQQDIHLLLLTILGNLLYITPQILSTIDALTQTITQVPVGSMQDFHEIVSPGKQEIDGWFLLPEVYP